LNKKDVVFRHSALRPYYVKNGMAESEKKKDGASEKTWNHMEFDFRVTMQKFKEEAKRKRQRLQDSVLGMLMDSAAGKKIIAHDEEWDGSEGIDDLVNKFKEANALSRKRWYDQLSSLEDWVIPKVHFLEARERTREYVTLPLNARKI